MRISDWSSDVCSSDLTASHDPGISAADDEELLGHELEYGHLAEAVRQLSCSTSRHAGDDEALLAPATIRRAAEARHRDVPVALEQATELLVGRSVLVERTGRRTRVPRRQDMDRCRLDGQLDAVGSGGESEEGRGGKE